MNALVPKWEGPDDEVKAGTVEGMRMLVGSATEAAWGSLRRRSGKATNSAKMTRAEVCNQYGQVPVRS